MVKPIDIKQRTEKRKLLEKRLNENTIAIKKIYNLNKIINLIFLI